MTEGRPRLARLTAIVTQLQSKRMVTAREIAEKHQISIRTVYRDIKTLNQSGIPIITEEGKGYSLMNGYKLPPVLFTEEEANALVTAEQIISNNTDASLVQSFGNALEKIKAVLRYSQKEKVELLSERLQIRNYSKTEKTSQFLIQLQKAITRYQLVELEYLSLKEELSTRKAEPFALIQTQENWLLIAYCRLRNEFRMFRLDRIEKLVVFDTQFTPHKITLEEFYGKKRKEWLTTPDIPLTQAHSTFAVNIKKETMQTVKIKPFKVIGIAVRTTNENGQSAKDIGRLWQKFMAEDIASKIPNKVDMDILSIYTNYESDHTKPYDTILGCKVSSLDEIPEGMVGQDFDGGTYVKYVSKGNLTKGSVYTTWAQIWNTHLDRTYSADFEVYGTKALNPTDAEVDVLVAVNS